MSFEKDKTNSQSQLIDLDAVLLIFVNGVLQKPGESYQFQGGTTFTFTEAPTGESSPGANDHDNVDIFFYFRICTGLRRIKRLSDNIASGPKCFYLP